MIDDNVSHWLDACCFELLEQVPQLVDVTVSTVQVIKLAWQVALEGGKGGAVRPVEGVEISISHRYKAPMNNM